MSTLQAIISDVHSNLEALQAVLNDIKAKGISQIVSIGDLVGYGPNPVECIIMAMDNKFINLYGNHEVALFQEAAGFNPKAKNAIHWTRAAIKKYSSDQRVKTFLKGLKDKYEAGKVTYVHGSPKGTTRQYLIRKDDFFKLTPEVKQSLKDNFELIEEIGFIGHTHIPCVCTTDFYLIHPEWQEYQPYPLLLGTKTIINVGSVGQPRDHDIRACYATFDGKNVTHHRVEYDVEKTIAKIEAIPHLDDSLGHRLRKGK